MTTDPSPRPAASDPGPGAGGKWKARLLEGREEIVMLAITGIPIALLQWVISKALGGITGQPWHALFLLGPLAALAWVLWRRAVRPGDLRLSGSMLLFLGAYVLVFTVAAQSRVVDWQRSVTGYDDVRPASPFGLSWIGDWRYHLLPRERPDGIAVVLMDPTGREDRRMDLIRLFGIARAQEVRGIALDFYFLEPTRVDASLCRALDRSGLTVFAGFGIRYHGSQPVERSYPSSLAECFPSDQRGHLLVFRERDDRVRSLPLQFRGETNQDMPALSLRAAEFIREDAVPQPDEGLLQFIAPDEALTVVDFANIERDFDLLKREFLLVGERSSRDRFRTPGGEVPGVMLHAAALHSLQTGRFIERAPGWLTAAVLLLGCYGLLVLARRGAGLRALAALAAALSLAVLGGAAVAITQRIWIDVVYIVAGLWLLVGLLVAVRRRIGASPQPGPGPGGNVP